MAFFKASSYVSKALRCSFGGNIGRRALYSSEKLFGKKADEGGKVEEETKKQIIVPHKRILRLEEGDMEEEESLYLTVDWRSFFGPVKNQGSSIGCLPITVAEAVGAAHRIATGEEVELSAQFIMDTIPGTDYEYETTTMECVLKHGLPLEVDYPARKNYRTYRPRVLKPDARRIFIRGYEPIHPPLVSTALMEGPLLVTLSCPQSYTTYDGSRIIYGEDENKRQQILHSQLLVGEGFYMGYPISLIRGTYGSKWGLDGYAYLYRDMRGGRGVYGVNETVTRIIV